MDEIEKAARQLDVDVNDARLWDLGWAFDDIDQLDSQWTFLVKTQDEVASRLGVSRRTIVGWLNAGCPGKGAEQCENGYFNLHRIARWRLERGDLRALADNPAFIQHPLQKLLQFRALWGFHSAQVEVPKMCRELLALAGLDETQIQNMRLLIAALASKHLGQVCPHGKELQLAVAGDLETFDSELQDYRRQFGYAEPPELPVETCV